MKSIFAILSFCTFNAIAAPVNVNTADAKSISEALNDVGEKKTEAMVKYR